MVTIFQASGFYSAPVCKFFLLLMFTTSLISTFSDHFYRWTYVSASDLIYYLRFDSYLLSKIVFLNPAHMICASILIFAFRVFERRFGSRKFSSYLLAVTLISSVLEIVVVITAYFLNYNLKPMPTGFWAPLFSLYVLYYKDIPRVTVTQFWGIPVTGKSVSYLIGFQMVITSVGAFILSIIGVISGVIVYMNQSKITSHFQLPDNVVDISERCVGRLVRVKEPKDSRKYIGATIEIQRQQYMEAVERSYVSWDNYYNQQSMFNFFQGPNYSSVEPSEEQVQALVDMGFSRDQVLTALRDSHNDTSRAANMLTEQE